MPTFTNACITKKSTTAKPENKLALQCYKSKQNWFRRNLTIFHIRLGNMGLETFCFLLPQWCHPLQLGFQHLLQKSDFYLDLKNKFQKLDFVFCINQVSVKACVRIILLNNMKQVTLVNCKILNTMTKEYLL